jgi:hypothetical protein
MACSNTPFLMEELKEKFHVTRVEDLGDCLVIPGDELDLDWLLSFFELGHRFEGTFLDGNPTVLVQLKQTLENPNCRNETPEDTV